MKKCALVGFALFSLVGLADPVPTNVWSRTGSNTIDTPYLWDDADNWLEGATFPSTSEHFIDFNTVADPKSVRWIVLPENVTMKRLLHQRNCGDLYLLGTNVTFYGEIRGSVSNVWLFADSVTAMTANAPWDKVNLCSDISSTQSQSYNSSLFCHRLDRYARAPGGARINPGLTWRIQQASGKYGIICPESSSVALTSAWTLTAGSPLARRVDTENPRHALPVGTAVTASDGMLPDATWLKRIYDDNTIELSAPATTSGAATLTFAAQKAVVRQSFDQIATAGADVPGVFYFSQYRADDDCEFSVRSINRASANYVAKDSYRFEFDSLTPCPGRVVLHTTSSLKCRVRLVNCHLQFDPPAVAGETPGINFSPAVYQNDANAYARLTVTNGLVASVANFSNLVGTVVKDGAGTLTLEFAPALDAVGANLNTGSLTVEEGVLNVTAKAGETTPRSVKSLDLKAGVTLAVPEVGLQVDEFTFEPGAVLAGPGALLVTKPVNPTGLVLTGGASVEIVATGSKRPLNDVPTGKIVGNPAFWVDASAVDSLTLVKEGDVTYVTRWNDCRGDGYMFATNVASVRPTLLTDYAYGVKAASNAVQIAYHDALSTEIEKTEALVWSRPIEGIRAVFKVHDPELNGGTAFLGSTARIAAHKSDFRRWNKASTALSSQIFQDNAAASVIKGRHYLNGIQTTFNSGYPLGSYKSGAGKRVARTLLQECHPNAGDTAADCFGFTTVGDKWNGGERISECLVYTNELTETERLQVAQYLMEKWTDADVSYERFPETTCRSGALTLSGDTGVSVSGGTAAYDSLGGSGTFVKDGEGTVYFDTANIPSGGVKAKAGTVVIRSSRIGATTLPAGAYLHLDAEDESSFTYLSGAKVEAWQDVRGEGYLTATKINTKDDARAERKSVAALGGRSVVDFGAAHNRDEAGYEDNKRRTGLAFEKLQNARTVVMLYGSANGGGCFLGSKSGDYDQGGITRGGDTLTDPYGTTISSPFSGMRQAVPKYIYGRPLVAGGAIVRMDGVRVNQAKTGFSGGYQVVSLLTHDAVACDAFSSMHYGRYFGGQEIGEAIIYEHALSTNDVNIIEAYLMNKWFGTPLPEGWTGSTVGALDVAEGATVEVEGLSPLTVGSLSGAGTVTGEIALTDAGVLAVPVAADGSTPTLTVGSVAFGPSASVVFSGSVRLLTAGEHVLVSSPSIHAGDAIDWTVTGLGSNRTCAIRVVEGAVIADIAKKGLAVIVR